MYKKLVILFTVAVSLASCDKVKQRTPCGPQVCTDVFATINVHYFDNSGKPVVVNDFSVFNVTSNKLLHPGMPATTTITGNYIVASDYNKMDYSTGGDVIRVSATDPSTNQTKTVNFKISGGCNCHVAKISGPDTVKFE